MLVLLIMTMQNLQPYGLEGRSYAEVLSDLSGQAYKCFFLLIIKILPILVTGHDAFSDFVANEHINHTSVSISAGNGLTGGGDISANRTISLSHLGIQSLTDPGADRILFWDDSATATGMDDSINRATNRWYVFKEKQKIVKLSMIV